MGRRQRRREPLVIELDIKTLAFGGQGIGHYEDATVFVWNALPGERVKVLITKRKKDIWEGVAEEVITASPDRQEPNVAHYISSSPWQIMPERQEQKWKLQLAQEVYERIGKLSDVDVAYAPETQDWFAYRNKIEFSFFEYDDDDERGTGMALSFFQRGTHFKQPITHSELAEPIINTIADAVLAWINEQGYTRRDVKSLIIRSNGKGEAVAALFVKNHVQYNALPSRFEHWNGFRVYYSNPRSPASVITEELDADGDADISIALQGVNFTFGINSFFQVNIPVFEIVLADIVAAVSEDLSRTRNLIDMYSGVGAIGISVVKQLAEKGIETSLKMIESNAEAVEYANKNIESNAVKNAEAILAPAEAVVDHLVSDATVIVDPPRAGLHEDVRKKLLEVQPERIVYMSCNVSTQARDLQELSEMYTIDSLKVYNMFPRTPHIEALAILTKKK